MVRRWGEFFFWGGGGTFGPEGLYFGIYKFKFYTQNFFFKNCHMFLWDLEKQRKEKIRKKVTNRRKMIKQKKRKR